MLNLIDGPCMGIFMVKRAPKYLRAVVNTKGKTDVLDQIEDTPGEDEIVYVYRLEGSNGIVHIHGKPSVCGWYALGQYHWMPEVNGQELRDNTAWQKWALANDKESVEAK